MTSSLPAPSGINPNARILVVADQPGNMAVMQGILAAMGFWLIDSANNGASALLLFRAGIYDLVIMDGDIGRMGGFDAAQRMRGFEEGRRRTPIIAVSPHAATGSREKSLKAGIDDHLSKPLDAARWRRAILQYLPGDTPLPSALRVIGDIKQRELLTLASDAGNAALNALMDTHLPEET